MKQIKTKKELLAAFDECRNNSTFQSWDTQGNVKKKIFDKGTEKIINFLEFADEDIEFPEGLRCLELSPFCDFVINASAEKLEASLNDIYHDLKLWKDLFSCNNKGYNVALVGSNNIKQQRDARRRSKKKFIYFLVFFAIFSAIAVICTVLNAGELIEKNTPIWKACAIIAALAGVVDMILGVAFGAREIIDDKKRITECNEAEEAMASQVKTMNDGMEQLQSGGVSISIKNVKIKKGNGNNIGVVNKKT